MPDLLRRLAAFDSRALDGDFLTFSASSEEPVEFFGQNEILEHTEEAVDLSRLASGRAPLLIDHRNSVNSIVGRIERAWLEDRRLRVRCRIGRDEGRIRDKINDGLIVNVSIGYETHATERVDDATYKVVSWTPVEVSLVAVPADPTVGVGRTHGGKPIMGQESTTTPNDDDRGRRRSRRSHDEVAEAERERIADMADFASGFGDTGARILAEVLDDGGDFRELRERLRDERDIEHRDRDAKNRRESREAEREIRSMQARQDAARTGFPAILSRGMRGDPVDAEFSMRDWILRAAGDAKGVEGGREMEQVSQGGKGYRFGGDLMARLMMKRAPVTSASATGGSLVSTDVRGDLFIDTPLAMPVVASLGATQLADLDGNVSIPKRGTRVTTAWLGETGAVSDSSPTYTDVDLVPHEIGALAQFSRKLMIQSSPDVEQLIRRDIADSFAHANDVAAINGSGSSNQPTGLLNTTSLPSLAIATNGGALTKTHVETLIADVIGEDYDPGTLAFAVGSKLAGKMLALAVDTGSGRFVTEFMGRERGFETRGFPTAVSNVVPQALTKGSGTALAALIFGQWRNLILAYWTGVDILVDPFTKADERLYRVVGYQDLDVGVRNLDAFKVVVDAETT